MLARARQLTPSPIRIVRQVLLSLPVLSLCCYPADIIFVRASEGSPTQETKLEIATKFYGLNLKVIPPNVDEPTITKALQETATVAVIIAANALAHVDQEGLLRALDQRPGGSVPLLIVGVTPETDETLLKAWSGGAVAACR